MIKLELEQEERGSFGRATRSAATGAAVLRATAGKGAWAAAGELG